MKTVTAAFVITTLVVLLVAGVYFAPREKPTPRSVGEDEIMYIEELLASTTNVLIDNQGDFVDPGSGTPPKGIYSFAPVDMLKISVANDNESLYIKFEMAGKIPSWPVVYNGNTVHQMNINCAIDNDRNRHTGSASNDGAEALVIFGTGLKESTTDESYMSVSYYAEPTGIEEPENARFARFGILDGIIEGGIGENYVIVRLPLFVLGLHAGMDVDILCWAEAASDQWHHFSFDQAPEVSRGENKFTCEL
jgi:hypothetical protein